MLFYLFGQCHEHETPARDFNSQIFAIGYAIENFNMEMKRFKIYSEYIQTI